MVSRPVGVVADNETNVLPSRVITNVVVVLDIVKTAWYHTPVEYALELLTITSNESEVVVLISPLLISVALDEYFATLPMTAKHGVDDEYSLQGLYKPNLN